MSHSQDNFEFGNSKKTLKSYSTGLVLCIALTVISFLLIEKRLLPIAPLYLALTVLAIIQFFVQATCFLGLSHRGEGKWNLMPFLFVLLIIFLLAGGSIWIMYSLNYMAMQ